MFYQMKLICYWPIRLCLLCLVYQGGWFTHRCFAELQHSGKTLNELTVPTTPSTTSRINKVCPAGFTSSDKVNKCYIIGGIQDNPKLFFFDVKKACANMSSEFKVQLASINSADEQDLVNSLTSKLDVNVWIGLMDEKGDAWKFTWQDGSAVTYTKWALGYPKEHIHHKYLGHYAGDSKIKYIHSRFRLPYHVDPPYRYVLSCVEILSGPIFKSSWRTAECLEDNAYLCQTPKVLSTTTPVTNVVSKPLSTITKDFVDVTTTREHVSSPSTSTIKDTFDVTTSREHAISPSTSTIKDIVNIKTSTDSVSHQGNTSSPNSADILSVSKFPSTDRISDQSYTIITDGVILSSSFSKDSFNFTSLTDRVNDRSSINGSDSVNDTSLMSVHSASHTSLTKSDITLIVIGCLILVVGMSVAVVFVVRLKRRGAQIPIQSLTYDGGFYNVLYSVNNKRW